MNKPTKTSNVEASFVTSPEEVNGFHWEVLRPLTEEEFRSLMSGIAEDGIVSSIVLDRDGNVIDGGHRLRAWRLLREEGYDIPSAPVLIRKDIGTADETAARLLARKLNMQRRQLSEAEKREVIRAQLRETPERSDTWIANDLGVKSDTVTKLRLEAARTDPQFRDRPDPTLLPEYVDTRDGRRWRYKPRKSLEERLRQPSAPDRRQEGREEGSGSGKNAKRYPGEARRAFPSPSIGEILEDAPEEVKRMLPPPPEPPSHLSRVLYRMTSVVAELSRIDPLDAAEEGDPDPEALAAKELIASSGVDWLGQYREALAARAREYWKVRRVK